MRDQPPFWQWLWGGCHELFSASTRFELAVVFREVAAMLGSGLLISTSVGLLAEHVRHRGLREAFRAAEARIDAGASLSQALASAPHLPPTVVHLIRVGETTGRLPLVLDRIAAWLEREHALHLRMRAALTYPLLLAALSLVTVVVLPAFLMGGVFAMLDSLGGDVPLLTRIVAGTSWAFRQPLAWLAILALAVGAAWIYRGRMRDPDFRAARDAWLLRLPILGPAFRCAILARFCRTLETMYVSGVPILSAITAAAEVTGNRRMECAAAAMSADAANGVPLGEAARRTGFFPPMYLHVLDVGYQSGRIPQALDLMARSAEETLQHRLEVVQAAFEPIVLLCMGLVVGLIVLATLLPLAGVLEKLGS